MTSFPFLSILICIPLMGALIVFFVPHNDEEYMHRNIKFAGLWITVCELIFSLVILFYFEDKQTYQFIESYPWLWSGSNFTFGIDGLSLLLILLTTFLTPLALLSTMNVIKHRVKEFFICFLLMESFVIGTFCSLDLLLFYILFESVLIPMFFIIGIWGGANRIYATFKFFLYTLFGSIFMLVTIAYIMVQTGSSDIRDLPNLINNLSLSSKMQFILWLGFFGSFAIKTPMWPVHTWLPDAHVQAPTSGSVILAGVLLKMGGYGMIRFCLGFFPQVSLNYGSMVMGLGVLAIVIASVVALVQKDMKKMVAYSSVAHMGYVVIGIFAANQYALSGAIFQMISHGIVSAALFFSVGVLYDRMHTRMIDDFGGVVKFMPLYSVLLMIFCLGSVALPGTSGFIGEFLVLIGTFANHAIITAMAGLGIILGAAYILILYRQVILGGVQNKEVANLQDLNSIEKTILISLAALVIFMGFYPNPVLNIIQSSSVFEQISNTMNMGAH